MVDTSIETNATTSPVTPSLSRDECTPDLSRRLATAITEADLARLHRKYAEQIATLESQLQLKEALVIRYRQRVADQETQISDLNDKLLAMRCSPPQVWEGDSRSTLIDSMCEARLERLCKRLRPHIVKINLSVGHLSAACERLTEDTLKAELFLALPAGPSPLSLLEATDHILADTLEFPQNTAIVAPGTELYAFQRSKLEIKPIGLLSKPCGDQSPSPQNCFFCDQMAQKVSKLQQEVRKHRHFITTMKTVIQGLVQPGLLAV